MDSPRNELYMAIYKKRPAPNKTALIATKT